jgi:sRNA-binding carbon storage regulator CsrA
MLIIQRRINEKVVVVVDPDLEGPISLEPGQVIGEITLTNVRGQYAKIGFDFPVTLKLLRGELDLHIKNEFSSKPFKEIKTHGTK